MILEVTSPRWWMWTTSELLVIVILGLIINAAKAIKITITFHMESTCQNILIHYVVHLVDQWPAQWLTCSYFQPYVEFAYKKVFPSYICISYHIQTLLLNLYCHQIQPQLMFPSQNLMRNHASNYIFQYLQHMQTCHIFQLYVFVNKNVVYDTSYSQLQYVY